MKKTSSFVLGFAIGAFLFGGSVAYAAGILAQPKTAAVVIDGKAVDLKGYLIEGSHYFQLRDLATALAPGGKDFSIVWDGAANTIRIDTRRGYDPNEIMAIVVPTSAPTPTPKVSSRTAPAGVLAKDLAIWLDEDYALYENETEALQRINEERANAGLNPVTVNLDLCRVARIKAVEMVELDYFSHESPNYGLPPAMVQRFGIPYRRVAENAAYLGGSSARGVVWNWMHSEAHKRNILNPNHREIGIGFANKGGVGYWSLLLMS